MSCDFIDHKIVKLKVKKKATIIKTNAFQLGSDLIKLFTTYYFFFSRLIKLQSL